MSPTSRYDVIIIGSGAGGATLAWRLAATQKSVLVLERGDYLPREAENWNSDAVFVRNRYKTREEWLDRRGRKFKPATHYCVGGNTKVYGAALFRLRERDFTETIHEDGISPAWPISYADLAPYYLAAERLYQVHGRRGSDPTEPPCDADCNHPPVIHSRRCRRYSTALRAGAADLFRSRLRYDSMKAGHKPARASSARPAMVSHACCMPRRMLR